MKCLNSYDELISLKQSVANSHLKSKENLKKQLNDVEKYKFSDVPKIEYFDKNDDNDENDEIDIDLSDVDGYKDILNQNIKRDIKSGDPEEQYNKDIQPLTDNEIRDTFEDAIKEARKSESGKIIRVDYEPGGKVKVDHSIQE